MKKWISEHRLFSLLSGIVVVLILVIFFSFISAGGSSAISRGFQSGIAWLERPFSAFSQGVKKNVGGIFRYKKLQAENEKLQAKVDKLEEENKDLQLKENELEELEDLSKAFDYDPFEDAGKAVVGRVIEVDNSSPYVVFTVDVGTEKHIKKNDIVVNGSGLVGRVQEAGKGYSKIVSVLSTKNSISFKAQRKTSITGLLKGDGKGNLTGYVMDDDMAVLKGDKLVTSGIGIYPEGIRIGTVTKIDYDQDRQLKTVTVSPTVDFDALQKVAIFYEY